MAVGSLRWFLGGLCQFQACPVASLTRLMAPTRALPAISSWTPLPDIAERWLRIPPTEVWARVVRVNGLLCPPITAERAAASSSLRPSVDNPSARHCCLNSPTESRFASEADRSSAATGNSTGALPWTAGEARSEARVRSKARECARKNNWANGRTARGSFSRFPTIPASHLLRESLQKE